MMQHFQYKYFHLLWQTKFKYIHLYNRSLTIPLQYLGIRAYVYNGKYYFSFLINEWRCLKKFGEFSKTRQYTKFKKKKKKKKK